MARDAVGFYQPLADLRSVALSSDGATALTASGDPLLLTQAVGNRIDLAHNHPGLRAALIVSPGPQRASAG